MGSAIPPDLILVWLLMCSLRCRDVLNSLSQVLQVYTLTPASSLRCSSRCKDSWLCRTNSSPHSGQIRFCSVEWKDRGRRQWTLLKRSKTQWSRARLAGQLTSSFSCSMMWDLRLAMRENFLLHTGQVKSEVVCVDLWSVRLNSTLNVCRHWSHRWGCKKERWVEGSCGWNCGLKFVNWLWLLLFWLLIQGGGG